MKAPDQFTFRRLTKENPDSPPTVAELRQSLASVRGEMQERIESYEEEIAALEAILQAAEEAEALEKVRGA